VIAETLPESGRGEKLPGEGGREAISARAVKKTSGGGIARKV